MAFSNLFRRSPMKLSDTKLEIRTLGSFSISVNGRAVAVDWPDETLKVLFCSLLSPFDSFFCWDRICRSLWGIRATQTSRSRLEDIFIPSGTIGQIQECICWQVNGPGQALAPVPGSM